MKSSPFTFVKVSDYGTSNSIVARTFYQSQQLLKLYAFDKEFEKHNSEVMWEIQRQLLNCYEKSSSIINEIENSKLAFKEKVKNDLSFHPWIMNLDTRLESFFQSAKLGLRNIGGILKLFFGEDFVHFYHKALKWAKEQFGEDDPLTKTLNSHSKWIVEVIDIRNAIEHPKEKQRGRFHVDNFRIRRCDSRVELAEPLWWLTDDPPYIVSAVLPIIVEQLLRLSEELYVTSLIKQKTPILVEIKEIPEDNRDKSAPMRFRATGLSIKSKK